MLPDSVVGTLPGYLSLWTLYMLALCAGCVTLVSVYLLRVSRRSADERAVASARADKTVKQNCWFCNEDVDVLVKEKERWMCPHCQQYNGFTQDGDYLQPPEGQFDVKDFKTRTFCIPGEVSTPLSVLCKMCSQNQVLKVRQLAAFVPFCENNYDSEVDMYRQYLESLYILCTACKQRVSDCLTHQDKKIVAAMEKEHLALLDQLEGNHHLIDGGYVKNVASKNRESMLCLLMWSLCACAGGAQLLIYVTTGGPSHTDVAEQTLAQWLDRWGNHAAVSLGTLCCTCGLVATGRYRLYPEDAAHLMLWLVSMAVTCVLPESWLCVTREASACVAATAALTSLLCCWRQRSPRHFADMTIHRRHLDGWKRPQREAKMDADVVEREAKMDADVVEREARMGADMGEREEDSEQATAISVSSSSSCMDQTDNIRESTPSCENIRQNLESFSLGLTRESGEEGLTKKSGLSSSIWSLPAVVTSLASDPSPDSSTDRPSHGILYPGRLNVLQFTGSGCLAKSTETSQCFPDEEKGPCDSQSSYLMQHCSSAIPDGAFVMYQTHTGLSPSHTDLSRLHTNMSPSHRTWTANQTEPVTKPCSPRRSARCGKFSRPWALKKSFSCSNALDMGLSFNRLATNSLLNQNSSNNVRLSQSTYTDGRTLYMPQFVPTTQPAVNTRQSECRFIETSAPQVLSSSIHTTTQPDCNTRQPALDIRQPAHNIRLPVYRSVGHDITSQSGTTTSQALNCKLRQQHRNLAALLKLGPGLSSSDMHIDHRYRNHDLYITKHTGSDKVYRNVSSRTILSELSDDDLSEGETLHEKHGHKNRHSITRPRRTEIWTWIFVGVIIGASISTNMFLIYWK